MKKILVVLLSIIMIFTLTACGTESNKEESTNEETNQKENTVVDDNKNENNQNEIIDDEYIDDEIIESDDTDNNPTVDEVVNVSEVINCPGCVYAYFSAEGDAAKKIGDTLSPNEYTSDIRTLKTGGRKQRHNFFGLVLSGNTISKAYACILKDNKIYCLQGSSDGAYHQSNIAVLNQVFTGSQCKTISDGHTYTCTDGSYNGDTKTNGYTSMHYETSCTIYGGDSSNVGKLICH